MFVGEKLTDIRLLHGYSRNELARMLNVSEQSVWQYENNYNGPKLEIIYKLTLIFNAKSNYFYNKKAYKTHFDPSSIAYRSKTYTSVSKSKYEVMHLAFFEGLINLFEQYITYPQNILLSMREYCINYINDNDGIMDKKEIIKHIAVFSRERLGLGANNQNLLFVLEKNGAFIFEKSLGANVDAYSTWSEQDRPIIMLGNFKKSAVRRNFDLAHELGHLLLHYKMDLSDLSNTEYKKTETEANAFASFFLLPEREFLNDLQLINRLSNPNSYIELKEKWSVSIVAMVHYARKLGVISYDQHRYFYASLTRMKFTQMEPLDDTIKIIRPGKIKSSLQYIFDRKLLTPEQLIHFTNYNEVLIAKILGIDEAFIYEYVEKEPPAFSVSYLSEKRKVN